MNPPCFNPVIYYVIAIIPFISFDLGMKILTGLGGLGKAFNNANLHVIPWGVEPSSSFSLYLFT